MQLEKDALENERNANLSFLQSVEIVEAGKKSDVVVPILQRTPQVCLVERLSQRANRLSAQKSFQTPQRESSIGCLLDTHILIQPKAYTADNKQRFLTLSPAGCSF